MHVQGYIQGALPNHCVDSTWASSGSPHFTQTSVYRPETLGTCSTRGFYTQGSCAIGRVFGTDAAPPTMLCWCQPRLFSCSAWTGQQRKAFYVEWAIWYHRIFLPEINERGFKKFLWIFASWMKEAVTEYMILTGGQNSKNSIFKGAFPRSISQSKVTEAFKAC